MKAIKKTIVYEVLDLNDISKETEKEYKNGWTSSSPNVSVHYNPCTSKTVEIVYMRINEEIQV